MLEHTSMNWFAFAKQADNTQFRVNGPEGSYATGYTSHADFPNDRSHPERGELFYVEVPQPHRRKGYGTEVALQALKKMQEHGAKTVNISSVTPEGRALVDKLMSLGVISGPVRQSPTGKAEYRIT